MYDNNALFFLCTQFEAWIQRNKFNFRVPQFTNLPLMQPTASFALLFFCPYVVLMIRSSYFNFQII